MISMKKYGEMNKIIFSLRFVSMDMVAIFDFRALTKVHRTLQCKHHTKRCVFCIEMDSFWKHVIYVWIV